MPDNTPVLALPYIMPSQAQKHVTHNEALRQLDAIVQLVVIAADLVEPPLNPFAGDRYVVAAGASGAWDGQDGAVAVADGEGWLFYAAQEGWRADDLSAIALHYYQRHIYRPPPDNRPAAYRHQTISVCVSPGG